MNKQGVYLALLLCLTGCQSTPKVDKSRYGGAEVTLYYRSAFDEAYPNTYKCISPVVIDSELTEKILDFDASVRQKGNFQYKGNTGAEDASLIQYYRLKIKKPSEKAVKRYIYISQDRKTCMNIDEDSAKQSSPEKGQLYLKYDFSDKSIDSSFVEEIKKIVDSAPLISGKDED